MVTIVAGDGGLGKTTLALDIAARVTRGRVMPDRSEGLAEPAGVVVLSSEDAVDCVLVPRLRLAGADLERVATVGVKTTEGEERRLMITPEDLARLEGAVRAENVRLVIFDPLAAFVDEGTNLHHNQDARRVLARLHALAERCDIAVLGIHHFNRGQHQDAVHRLTGSAGIANAARSVLVVGPDPDEPSGERLVLAVAKRNLAPRSTPSLAYRLDVPAGEEHPVVAWEGLCAATANDLVAAPTDPEERSAQEDAVAFLRELLEGTGEVLATEGESAARARGIAPRTLDRARRKLRVEAFRPANPGVWYWRLPRTPRRPGALASWQPGDEAKALGPNGVVDGEQGATTRGTTPQRQSAGGSCARTDRGVKDETDPSRDAEEPPPKDQRSHDAGEVAALLGKHGWEPAEYLVAEWIGIPDSLDATSTAPQPAAYGGTPPSAAPRADLAASARGDRP